MELRAERDSLSLADIFGPSESAELDWENSVRYQVSRQLLFLRRAQGLRQSDVAKTAKTSQSAIARIESGEENITLDTLERLIRAQDGHFRVSICPASHRPGPWREWWEPAKKWGVAFVAMHKDGDHAVVGLQRQDFISATIF